MTAKYYNPYNNVGDDGRWLKAQFHCHNWRLPSTEEKEEGFADILIEYKAAGYDLVMHSGQQGWYDTSTASAEVGVATVNGQEYIDYDGILLVGSTSFFSGEPQTAVDACRAQGGFAIHCHPNQAPRYDATGRQLHLSQDQARALRGLAGVEVFNGFFERRPSSAVSYGGGLATDYWDEMLSKGHKLWGFGGDDSHFRSEINVGWTYIFARDTGLAAVKSAVSEGALYASTGLTLYDFFFDGKMLRVEADLAHRRTGDVRYQVIGPNGRLLHEQRGAMLEYPLPASDPDYVRVEACSADGAMLWSQPLLREDIFGPESLEL